MSADRQLAAIRRKLEAAELDHLRRHVVELSERLEEAEARATAAASDAEYAWSCAEQWREQAMDQINELAAMTGGCVGITEDGRVGVVDSEVTP